MTYKFASVLSFSSLFWKLLLVKKIFLKEMIHVGFNKKNFNI